MTKTVSDESGFDTIEVGYCVDNCTTSKVLYDEGYTSEDKPGYFDSLEVNGSHVCVMTENYNTKSVFVAFNN